MKRPDARSTMRPIRCLMHESKTDRHNQGYSDHDSDFGLSGHAPSCHVAFQIFPVKAGSKEPVVKFLRTSGKAYGSQKEERHCRQQRQNCPQSAKRQRGVPIAI